MSTRVSSVGAPSRSFSVRRLPQAFSSLGRDVKTQALRVHVHGRACNSASSHQLKEECRLAHRLGCWVSDVSDRAALPLLWWGNTAGEKTLFILTDRWGQTPCSQSNTWEEVHEGIRYTMLMLIPVSSLGLKLDLSKIMKQKQLIFWYSVSMALCK